jgi:YHS domain-containing protein
MIGAFVLGALAAAGGCAKKESAPLPSGEAKGAAVPEAASTEPVLADPNARAIAMQKPTYPIDTCVVCDAGLASKGGAKDVLHDGRLVRFCCDECAQKFAADPAASLSKIDAAIVKAQLASYPIDVCVIEGGKLGAMGPTAQFVYGTRLVQFCCPQCEPVFRENPAAAMAKIDTAYMDAQRSSYGVTECPLMDGMKIDSMGEPFDFLYGTRLVRLCCDQCVEKFWENPEAAIAKIDAAKGARASGA